MKMRATSFFAATLLATHALAQVATVTQYVTVPPAATASFSVSGSQKQATLDAGSSSTQQTTFATFTSNSIFSAYTSSATAQPSSTVAPAASPETTSDPNPYNGGTSGSGTQVDSDAGASGSGSSFSISKGGLIAVIVVVVVVAVFGIASTILFVVAKRRQWNVRASIRRASRRLTGRGGAPATPGRNNRRTTVHAGKLASPRVDAKRGIRLEERDVEKGGQTKSDEQADGAAARSEGRWAKRLWGNDWK